MCSLVFADAASVFVAQLFFFPLQCGFFWGNAHTRYVGFRRIDVPVISRNETANIDAIRFVCLDSVGEQIYLNSFAVYTKDVPW